MKYILGQLLQVSAWIGIILVCSAFIMPRWTFAAFGLLLFITNDDKLKGWVSRNAPGISNWIKEFTDSI